MKKILIVISHLQQGGGAEKSATMLGNELVKRGYIVNYLTFYKVKNKYNFKGFEFCLGEKFSKNIFKNIIKLFRRSYKIKKYCSLKNIDTVLGFKEDANIPVAFSKFFWKNKSKIIISIRGSIDKTDNLTKKIIKFLYPRVDLIIPITKEESYNLIHNYGINSEKVNYIYNMVNLKYIIEKSEEDLGADKTIFNNGKFTFINIGRLSEQKNQKILLNAFNKIYKNNSNMQLLILGDGELKKELQTQKSSLESNSDIHFFGVNSNPYKFLKNSDVFVFSSSWEGMPRSILEALSCNLPIISTDCPTGPKEILKNNPKNFKMVGGITQEDYGILTPINNENKLSEIMEKMYSDKKLNDYYSKQSKLRAKYFDIENIINKWISIL